jgi:hypothetical protein
MTDGRKGLFRRRPSRPDVDPVLRRAGGAFARTVSEVEAAKASLVSAVRSGRAPGAPLAEALAGFEAGLAAADASMHAWRTPAVEDQWSACARRLNGARVAAESLRLSGRVPEIYEELIAALDDLMDPLACFQEAAATFRRLGVRL